MAHLEELAAAMEPDAHGLTVLPFFQGPRAAAQPQPGASAGPAGDDGRGRETGGFACSATLTGMSLRTSRADILRAIMEAVALRVKSAFLAVASLLPDDSFEVRV